MNHIFLGALIFSIWAVLLFLGKSIGLSMLLLIVPFIYYILHILESNHKIHNMKAKILIIPITLLASTYFIYNNHFFNTINLLVIPIMIVIMIIETFHEQFNMRIMLEKMVEVIFEPIHYIEETAKKMKLMVKEKLNLKANSEKNEKLGNVIKGIIITIPIVIIIIILLSSADQVFGNIFVHMIQVCVNTLDNVELSNVMIRVGITICVFFYLASFFDNLLSRYEDVKEENTKKVEISKDQFTIKMILGALNMVYLLFCIIQIKSLFMRQVSINYAQYARKGFFQLMIVSTINLLTILIAKKSQNSQNPKSKSYITIMCLIMIVFTFIILVSSGMRMYFYERVYGYTLLRLLVYCALITETILLIPTIIYILDKNIILSKVYFGIIVIMYICMNFINMDHVIAQRNVERYIETGKIDMRYLKENTGTDAIDEILRILETSVDTENNKQDARKYLNQVYNELLEEQTDFRDLNLSKIFAKQLLQKAFHQEDV